MIIHNYRREFDRLSYEFEEVCLIHRITTVANVKIVKPRNMSLMKIMVPLSSRWNVPFIRVMKVIRLVPRGGGKALEMEVIVG